jgi:hypothetical protein
VCLGAPLQMVGLVPLETTSAQENMMSLRVATTTDIEMVGLAKGDHGTKGRGPRSSSAAANGQSHSSGGEQIHQAKFVSGGCNGIAK